MDPKGKRDKVDQRIVQERRRIEFEHTSNSDVSGIGDGRGSTEVGRNTDLLEGLGELDEGPGVSDGELVTVVPVPISLNPDPAKSRAK
jgi:hypothetical protein